MVSLLLFGTLFEKLFPDTHAPMPFALSLNQLSSISYPKHDQKVLGTRQIKSRLCSLGAQQVQIQGSRLRVQGLELRLKGAVLRLLVSSTL